MDTKKIDYITPIKNQLNENPRYCIICNIEENKTYFVDHDCMCIECYKEEEEEETNENNNYKNYKTMDTHTKNNPLNPINYVATPQEEKANELNQTIQNRLSELCEHYALDDPFQYLQDDFVDDIHEYTADEIQEELQDNGFFNVEIIYYSKAMEYLKEHDPSLRDSLELAAEFCYSTENLNSETLASLHASRDRENKFYDFVYPELDKITK